MMSKKYYVLIFDRQASEENFARKCKMNVFTDKREIHITIPFASEPRKSLIFPQYFLKYLMVGKRDLLVLKSQGSARKTVLFNYKSASDFKIDKRQIHSETGIENSCYSKENYSLIQACLELKNKEESLIKEKEKLKFHADADLNTPQDEIDTILQDLQDTNGPKEKQFNQQIAQSKANYIEAVRKLKTSIAGKNFIEASCKGESSIQAFINGEGQPFKLIFNFVKK